MAGCHIGREPPGWGEQSGAGPWLLFSITGDWGRADSKGICTSSKGEEGVCTCVCVLGDKRGGEYERGNRREEKQ